MNRVNWLDQLMDHVHELNIFFPHSKCPSIFPEFRWNNRWLYSSVSESKVNFTKLYARTSTKNTHSQQINCTDAYHYLDSTSHRFHSNLSTVLPQINFSPYSFVRSIRLVRCIFSEIIFYHKCELIDNSIETKSRTRQTPCRIYKNRCNYSACDRLCEW